MSEKSEQNVSSVPEICAELRRAREARGLSVADVANALKLTQRQVDAMESGHFEHLPGAAFARGFLRNYCRHLGLDAEPLLGALDSKDVAPRVNLDPVTNADGALPSSRRGVRPSIKPLLVIVALLLVVMALGAYFDWFSPKSASLKPVPLETPQPAAPAPKEQPPASPAAEGGVQAPRPQVIPDSVPAKTMPAPGAVVPPAAGSPAPAAPQNPGVTPPAAPSAAVPAPAPSKLPAAVQPAPVVPPAPAPATAAPAAAAPVPAGMSKLVFEFSGESWVEVRDAGGAVVHSGVGSPGNTREVVARPPFALVVGNAGQVRLSRDGRPVELATGSRSAVARLTLQ